MILCVYAFARNATHAIVVSTCMTHMHTRVTRRVRTADSLWAE
jgi:hypothetical protein